MNKKAFFFIFILFYLVKSICAVKPMVAAGTYHIAGLKTDGTVVAVGQNYDGPCMVPSWSGITQIAAGGYHTLGLKTDGTVVAMGDNGGGQCNCIYLDRDYSNCY